MCFYNDDAEWTANVVEKSTRVSDGKVKCNECWRVIPEGQTVHHIYQQEQEHGCCKRCENGDCSCPVDKDDDPLCMWGECHCEEPDYGETFDYDCCDECDKFLKAVEATEIDEGCRPDESQPSLCGLVEELRNLEGDLASGAYPEKRYFKKARAMFPELVASGYLKMLWEKVS